MKIKFIVIIVTIISITSCKMPQLATYNRKADLSTIEATPNGVNKKTFNDGSVYEGNFVNGLPSGSGKLITPDGKTIIGTFYQGDISYGKISFKNGNEYTGNFSGNIPNGKGYLELKDGSYYKGEFIDGKINGEGVFYKSNDQSFLYGKFDADLNLKDKGILIDANKNAQPVYYEKGSSENRYEQFVKEDARNEINKEIKSQKKQLEKEIEQQESMVQEATKDLNSKITNLNKISGLDKEKAKDKLGDIIRNAFELHPYNEKICRPMSLDINSNEEIQLEYPVFFYNYPSDWSDDQFEKWKEENRKECDILYSQYAPIIKNDLINKYQYLIDAYNNNVDVSIEIARIQEQQQIDLKALRELQYAKQMRYQEIEQEKPAKIEKKAIEIKQQDKQHASKMLKIQEEWFKACLPKCFCGCANYVPECRNRKGTTCEQ